MDFSDIKTNALDPADEVDAYWVVVVDDNLPPPPELRRFDSFALMAEFIKNVHKDQKTAWVLPFFGKVIRTTEGLGDSTLRFLVDANGARLPLFDLPEELQLSERSFYTPAGPNYIDPDSKAFDNAKSGPDSPQFGPGMKFLGSFEDNDEDEESSDIDY